MNENVENGVPCADSEINTMLTMEELIAENKELQAQADLHIQQYVKLKDQLNCERETWNKRRRELTREVEAIRSRLDIADRSCEKMRIDKSHERAARIASVPKLVVASLVATGCLAIPYTLQTAGVLDPRISYGIQSALMMVISWCYAMIWDRTRK